MNLNEMAEAIAELEGKAEEVNIAQIKEILAVIPVVYQKYIKSGNVGDTPYKIKQFIRMITRDEKLLPDVKFAFSDQENINYNRPDFRISFYGNYNDYRG